MTTIVDTDKSGQGFQKQRVYLGPSLGWSEEYVQPSTLIVTAGVYNVQPGDGLLLVDTTNGPVTINLPDVRSWFQQPATQPATGWNRQLCIKDFAGNALNNNITIVPVAGQRIDKNIGTTSLTVNYSVFLLTPNVDLSGWVIAAGTTSVLIPVGTFLPVNNPAATGKLTVATIGGDIAAMEGGPAAGNHVSFYADPASVDTDVSVNISSKNAGSVKFITNGATQAFVNGPLNAVNPIILSGGISGSSPTISSTVGIININDIASIGPSGGNRFFAQGSAAGQQGVILGVGPSSPDAAVNIHIVPKGAAGVNLYSNGTLQCSIAGPPTSTDYLVISGTSGYDDPVLATAGGGPVRVDDAIVAGPAGGNFIGLWGSAAGGQSVAVRADNAFNPDANINVDLVPKGNAGVNMYANGALQALVVGQPGTNRMIALTGATAPNNPRVGAAFGGNVEIDSLVMTGTPTAPTVTPSTDSSTKVATTAFVQSALSVGIGDVTKAGNNIFTGQNYFTTVPTVFGSSVQASPTATNTPQFVNVNPGLWKFSADALGDILYFRKSRNATVPNNTILQDTDTIGSIQFLPADGSGYPLSAVIQCSVDGTPAVNQVPSKLIFTTMGTSGSTTQRFEIDSAGRCTIGTSRPTTATGFLTIVGLTSSTVNLTMENYQAAAGAPLLNLRHSRGAVVGLHAAVIANDPLGILQAAGSDGSAFVTSGSILFACESAPTAGRVPTRIDFQTDNGTNYTIRARMFASGGLCLVSPFSTDPGVGNILVTGIKGLVDNTDAAAGIVGEYVEATGVSVALTASTPANICSIVLTPGDWDIEAHANYAGFASNVTIELDMNTVSATMTGNIKQYAIAQLSAGFSGSMALPMFRWRSGGTNTIFLIARASTAGQVSGIITARRVR